MASRTSLCTGSVPQKPDERIDSANTPPTRYSEPLTPPGTDDRRASLDASVSKTIAVFKSHLESSSPPAPTRRIYLLPRQYQQLQQELESPELRYITASLLYDYNPETGILDIRMPTPVHEVVSTSLAEHISEWLRHVASHEGVAGEFAAQIVNGGSSRILLDIEKNQTRLRRQPDAQFEHEKAAYPGLVLEISYSQDGKDLDKLAWEYVLGSNGDIKVVIGIDINYGAKASTVSLWRAHCYREEGDDIDTLTVFREIDRDPFRSSDGTHENQTRTLNLKLNDFTTDDLCKGLDGLRQETDDMSEDSGPRMLSISFAQLAKIVDKAERRQKVREQQTGLGVKSTRRLRKRKRSSSPPDEIKPEDEARFRRDEDMALDKVAAGDGDFSPGRN